MSSTEIYGILDNGEIQKIGRTHNATRGAMNIWQTLEEKYLPPFQPVWLRSYPDERNKKHYRVHSIDYKDIDEIWQLFMSGKMNRNEDIALGSTADYVIVMKENIPELIKVFRSFDSIRKNNSLNEQADIIEENLDKIIGICWNQTSVCSDAWISERYILDENDDKEYLPYNIFKDDKHWDLFKRLNDDVE